MNPVLLLLLVIQALPVLAEVIGPLLSTISAA